ncbi:MAG: hypothetical protein QM441_09115 [Synergistota bacterium]|nr:hypothetical protein [Synergistota bacterium]
MTMVKKALGEKGMSVHRLHQLVKGNRSMLYEAVNGRRRATGPLRERIAAALEADEAALFDANGMARVADQDTAKAD